MCYDCRKTSKKGETDVTTMDGLRRLVTAFLMVALLWYPLALTLTAEALETEAAQSMDAPAETDEAPAEPAETVPQQIPDDIPSETVPQQIPDDVPPETTVAVVETTEATEAQTLPAETISEYTQAVQPVVAPLEDGIRAKTLVTIAQANAMPKGSTDITVQGTVVFVGFGQVVLQDGSGGMRVFFDEDTGAALGDVLLVTGSRVSGFYAEEWEKTGTEALPAVETALAEAPENLRILIKDAKLGAGCLIQGDADIALEGTLPEGAAAGDTVDVYGVVLDGRLYADKIVKEETGGTWDTWYRISAEEIRAADIVAVTVVQNGKAWALGAGETGLKAVPVRLGADTMESQDGGLGWSITREGQKLILRSDAGWLCAQDENDGLRIGGAPERWEIQDGYLCHSDTGRYLCLHQQTSWQTFMDHQGEAAGQTVVFWRSTPVSADPGTEEDRVLLGGRWKAYFGLLHAHTNLSDGFGDVEDAFAHAAQVDGLDFFAVTDHSDSFDNADAGTIGADGTGVSGKWARGKTAAAAVTDERFVGLFGYEMTWQEDRCLGHISTFNTPGWQTRDQEGYGSLQTYYEALASVPGSVSQFNHPGAFYGDFEDFSHRTPAADNAIQLLEVGGEGGFTAYPAYTRALDQGWHVAPSNSQNNHNGAWGDKSDVRTVVLAETLTEAGIFEAIRNYRVYATEDKDLTVFYQLNGQAMGSIMRSAADPRITVFLSDPTDTTVGTVVEVIVDKGKRAAQQTVQTDGETLNLSVPGGYGYYYLRITQPDGDIAVTAPVWMEDYADMGIDTFTADPGEAVQGKEVNLTLSLQNRETVNFTIDSLRFTLEELDGQGAAQPVVLRECLSPGVVHGADAFVYEFPFTWSGTGPVKIHACVTGTVEGETRTYEKELTLRYAPDLENLPIGNISDVRKAGNGEVFRIKGYVTAGNSNQYTTFPGTIYLQDNTGGIAVTAFPGGDIQIGCPLEVIGKRGQSGGNPVLQMIRYTLPQEDSHRYVPRTMSCAVAMNYDTHGGELLQVEGKVVSVTPTADGKGVSRFIVEDIRGERATVLIEDYIRSGAHGTNELASQVKLGRTVRAMGLGHLDENGVCVLRVRNCEEVVYVPPLPDASNPKTGDSSFLSGVLTLLYRIMG